MNIVVIGRALPGNKTSVGKFEFEQARLLAEHGQNVAYLFSDNRSIKGNHRIGGVEKEQQNVYVFGANLPLSSRFLRAITNRAKTRALSRLLARAKEQLGGIDVVYIHFPLLSSTPEFVDLCVEREIPVVVMEHWTHVQERILTDAQEDFVCELAQHAASYCCVSDDLRTSVEAILVERGLSTRIEVVPNCISGDFKYLSLPREGFDFVAVGRLVDTKRFDFLVDAYAKCAAFSETRLLIVGEGPAKRSLERKACELGLGERVVFLGWKDSAEVARIFSRAGCYVSASPIETFGVPFAEAWMCGTPCVGPRNNPLRDHFDETNGILFETESIESLAQALDEAYARKDSWDNAAISSGGRSFSAETIFARLMEILTDAVASNKETL